MCSMNPCQAADECTYNFVFVGKFGTRKTKISHKMQIRNKYLAGETDSVTGSQGVTEHVRQVSGSISIKRRGHWMLYYIFWLKLEPARMRTPVIWARL